MDRLARWACCLLLCMALPLLAACQESVAPLDIASDLPSGSLGSPDSPVLLSAAKAGLKQVTADAARELGPSFEVTVTIRDIAEPSPNEGVDPPDWAVHYLVEAWPKSREELRYGIILIGHASAAGSHGFAKSGDPYSIFRSIRKLPDGQQQPILDYLSRGSVAATDVTNVDATPLGESWKDLSGTDPPVKGDLLEIAERKGYRPAECLWVTYFTDEEWPKSEHAELIGFDPNSRHWKLLATRSGGGDNPAVPKP